MKKLLAVVLVLMLSLTLFAACTTKTDQKILRMGISSVEGVFNPILASQVYDNYVVSCVFDALIDNTTEGVYVPQMADWEVSEDHLTYTFTLKDGVKFSDGTPVTAEDVAFTYTTIAHPEYDGPRSYAVDLLVGYNEYHSGASDVFEGIKVIDEKTISFTFVEFKDVYEEQPVLNEDGTPKLDEDDFPVTESVLVGQEPVASPANIECFVYGIMSKEYYAFESWEEFKALNAAPMGAGICVFDSWGLNEFVKLLKNDGYWDPDNGLKIDGVLLTNVPEESMIGALSAGEIDFGQLTATMDNYTELNKLENVSATTFAGNGYTYMQFNTLRGAVSDVKVRQALLYTLDRETFINQYYGDMASVAIAPFSLTSWACPDLSELNDYAYNPEKAGELLDEAGWLMGTDGFRYKDGEKLSIKWLVYEDSPWPAVLAGIAFDNWTQIGVELIIEKMDFVSVQKKTSYTNPADRDWDIYTMGFSLSLDPDPKGALFDGDAIAYGMFNASSFRDARAQELQAAGRAEFDQAARVDIYKEWALLQNELVPTIGIAYRNELWGINNRVQGLNIDTFSTWAQSLRYVTIAD